MALVMSSIQCTQLTFRPDGGPRVTRRRVSKRGIV